MKGITLGHMLNTLNSCFINETSVADTMLAAPIIVDIAGHSMLVTAVTIQPIPDSNPIKYTVRIKVTD